MTIKIDDLERLLSTAAGKYVSSPEAEYFASLCIETHLRRSPRLNPLEEAIADIKVWREFRNGPQTVSISADVKKDAMLILDFCGLAPGLKLKYVHDELQERCQKNGIAAVGLRNSAGIITLLPWAFGLAQRDLIGIALFNGGVNCSVPHGGTKGIFGTLPLTYAIPTRQEPIVSDMATTEIPFFQLKNAKETGEPLPGGSAVDLKGLPTTDAAEALSDSGIANLLPIGGGFKGYSLMVLMEVLTGSLVRSLLSNSQTPGWHPTEYGAFIVAIDLGNSNAVVKFKSEVSDLCEVIRKQHPAEGAVRVSVPGDRGLEKATALRKIGEIEVADSVWKELTSATD